MAQWWLLSHAESMRVHAIRRLFNRYGIAIGVGEYNVFCAMCVDGRAPVIAPGHKGSTIHRLVIRGVAATAVFRPEHGAIVSFLPKGDREQLTRTPVRQQHAPSP